MVIESNEVFLGDQLCEYEMSFQCFRDRDIFQKFETHSILTQLITQEDFIVQDS
jgi:hypothetical protein